VNSPCSGESKLHGQKRVKANLSSQQRVRCSHLPAIHLLANLSCWKAQIIETGSKMKEKVKHFWKDFLLLEGMLHSQKLEL